MSRPRLLALLLALLTLLVYLPAGSYRFVDYDDTEYVTENAPVKNGLSGPDLWWALTAFHSGNWHPLTWLSHQVDCELFGVNAGPQHVVNVLFHAVNAGLVLLLIARLTGRLGPATMVAALFAWHPLHVESVAWISERKDVLSTFFALLALLSYAKFGREKQRTRFGLALLWFALGLLAKPMLVTLPLVFLLLDYWPLDRFHGAGTDQRTGARAIDWSRVVGLVGEKWPFLVLSLGSSVITYFAQKNGGAVVSLTRVPLAYRLENAPLAVVRYVGKFFWPTDLSPLYVLGHIYWWQALLSSGGLLLITAAVWRGRGQKPYLLVGWLWFAVMLVPVIGLIQVGSQSMADRYTYLPSVGFFLALVLLAADGLAQLQTPKIILAGGSLLALGACVSLTERQLPCWRDSEALFRHAIELNPANVVALINLGVTLQQQKRMEEALTVYRQAEQFEDGPYYQLHDNYGDLLDKLGRRDEALAEYGRAIRENPADTFAHNAAGSEWAALGQPAAALREFATAEKLDPHYAWPHVETAQLFLKAGRDAEAVQELKRAVALAPDDAQILAVAAHIFAANTNAAVRDGPAAMKLAVRANDLSGHTQPMVFDVMGMACAELGDFASAEACAQKALELAGELGMTNTAPLQARLDRYQHREPWREPLATTNAPAPR